MDWNRHLRSCARRPLDPLLAHRPRAPPGSAEPLAEDEARGRALAARIDGLKESDAYRKGHELADLQERVRAAAKAATRARQTADKHAADALQRAEEAERARAEAATQRSLTGHAESDTRRAADRAGLIAVHDEAAPAAAEHTADGLHRAGSLLSAAVGSREEQIGALRAAIREHRKAVERRDDALSERDESRERLDEAAALRDEASRRHGHERDWLAEALGDWARGCVQLAALDAEALVPAVEDERACDELVFAARAGAIDRFAAEEARWRTRRDTVREELSAKRHRRDDLAACVTERLRGRWAGRVSRVLSSRVWGRGVMSELSALPSTVVRPGDRRYPALSGGFNQRWVAAPEYVRLVRTPEEARAALAEAVAEEPADPERARIAVRSGGHCYEDFVCGEDVRVILDVSPMCGVSYDDSMKAYCVEAGATNGHVYRGLYPVSGKVLPGGSCFSVGLGGHVPAGGFGLLSRQHGLTVDYLYAVEVAVVDEDGKVRLVVARRDDEDSRLCELWWAHTGGGGGNFGVATRFWFRGLPQPPKQVMLTALAWDWKDVAEDDFAALVTAFGEYFRERQNPSTAEGKLFAMLKLNHVSNGQIGLLAQVDVDDPDGRQAMADFLAAVDGRIGPEATQMRSVMGEHFVHLDVPRVMPWLTATQMLDSGCQNRCGKYKSAYLRRPFTERQIDAMWAYLGNERYTDYANRQALIQIDSYGGAINMPLHQTAVRQRDSILKVQYQVYWTKHDPAEDVHIAWIRDAYKATFAETGGVPVADGEITDGCYIGYPDGDLADPRWNGSGQSWETLYYKDAYAKLQEVKRHWDPGGVFRHAQSVRP